MSLMDTIEDEIQQLADREAHWRGRALDLVGVVLENETCDELVDLARDILRDLRNERSLPIYGGTKPAAAAFRQVTVAAVLEIDRPVDQALPAAVVDPPTQIEPPVKQIAPDPAEKTESVKQTPASSTSARSARGWTEERRKAHGDKLRATLAAKAEKNGHAPAAHTPKTAESEHVPETSTPEGQMPPPKPNPYLAVRIDKARDIYRKHVNAGGVISNGFEGGLMDECGLNRTEVMRIREEMLAQRSDGATLKASRNAQKWDTTPPL
jgi:hypothetical protein